MTNEFLLVCGVVQKEGVLLDGKWHLFEKYEEEIGSIIIIYPLPNTLSISKRYGKVNERDVELSPVEKDRHQILLEEQLSIPEATLSDDLYALERRIYLELDLIQIMVAIESSDEHIRAWGQKKLNDGHLPGIIIGLQRKTDGLLATAEQKQVHVVLRCPKCKKSMSASVEEFRRLRELYPGKVGVPKLHLNPRPGWPHPHSCQQ